MTAILVVLAILVAMVAVMRWVDGRPVKSPEALEPFLEAWDQRLALTSHAAVFQTLSEDVRWQLHPAHRPCPKARDSRQDHLWITEVTTWRAWAQRNDVLPGQTRRWHRCDACGIQIADRENFWLDTAEQRRYAPPYQVDIRRPRA